MVTQALRLTANGLQEITNANGDSTIAANPYGGLGRPTENATRGTDAIFITARFRSGSTMLWNLFRHVPGCTAYYEPFNERRWFDSDSRGVRLDASHKHVDDYWREYDGLTELSRYYRNDWSDRHLFMNADFWDSDMERYIDCLIERAAGRPVLQFNRIDFRLPWLRKNFPRARVVHLYRHPREQWCSSLIDIESFPKDAALEEFVRHDRFYLRTWVHDLKYHFPFLGDPTARHPYREFYFIWRLSYLFGLQYGDYSIAYEQLVREPGVEIAKLMDFLGLNQANVEALRSLVAPCQGERWPRYADDEWFGEHESYCENVLRDVIRAPWKHSFVDKERPKNNFRNSIKAGPTSGTAV